MAKSFLQILDGQAQLRQHRVDRALRQVFPKILNNRSFRTVVQRAVTTFATLDLEAYSHAGPLADVLEFA